MKHLLLVTYFTLSLLSATYSQTKSTKRGICGDASPQDLATLSKYLSWYYNWGVEPPSVSQGELSGIEWVPMQWGGINSSQVESIESEIPDSCEYLLGFNEPNFTTQANLTPQQAADMWPLMEQIASDRGLKLVSPAVNWCGDCVAGVNNDPTDWLDKFIAACPDCHFDYIAIHNYAPYSSALKSYIDKFRKYKKPIWITEFAPWDSPKPDYAGVVNYMKEVIPMVENDTSVYRYSWFATRVKSNPDIDLLGADGELTKLGQLYATMPFNGADVSQIHPIAFLPTEKNINLPATRVTLTGNYYYPDENAVSVKWSQISGPGIAVFSKDTIVKPVVSELELGSYVFQMTVSADGKKDSARIKINVNSANIAKNKSAYSSSNQNGNPASDAVDGNLSTRWSSLDADPQWIKIDLGSTYNLTGAKIVWEAAYAKIYTIDVSLDDNNWETVYSTSNGEGGTANYSFNDTARWIRMYSTQRNTQQQYWGNSIWEFEVYGSEIATSAIEAGLTTNTVMIYPNPCSQGVINVVFEKVLNEDVNCILFDLLGKKLYQKSIKLQGLNVLLNLKENGSLNRGIYFLTIEGKNIKTRQKLIIK